RAPTARAPCAAPRRLALTVSAPLPPACTRYLNERSSTGTVHNDRPCAWQGGRSPCRLHAFCILPHTRVAPAPGPREIRLGQCVARQSHLSRNWATGPETTAGGCWLDQSKVKYRLVPERRCGIRQRKLNVCDPADSDCGM